MDAFYALAEPTRRSILEMLADRGQLPASAIARRFRSTPSAISQHLKVLRRADLVRMEKHHQQRIYSLNPPAVKEVEDWLVQIAKDWDDRFKRLDAMLEAEKVKESNDGQ